MMVNLNKDLILRVPLFVFLVAVASGVIGFSLMWLWNWLMPELFGLTVINFWQAIGLFILCSLLFKSIK